MQKTVCAMLDNGHVNNEYVTGMGGLNLDMGGNGWSKKQTVHLL